MLRLYIIFYPFIIAKEFIINDNMIKIFHIESNHTFETVIQIGQAQLLPYFYHGSTTIDMTLTHNDSKNYPLCHATR